MTASPASAAPPAPAPAAASAPGPAPAGAPAPIAAPQKLAPPVPSAVLARITQAYDLEEAAWRTLAPFFESRIGELQPQRDSQYLKALEIAHCDRELLDHQGHADRVLTLAERQAVREILKPGYAQHAFGGPAYGRLDASKNSDVRDVHDYVVDEVTYSLHNELDPEGEAELKAFALQKLKLLGLGHSGLKTKAMEMRGPELDSIHRRISLLQARRDLLVESYIYEADRLKASA
jgi:hypothetical protein